MNKAYQEVILGNNRRHVKHMWGELDTMLDRRQACVLHGSAQLCGNPPCPLPDEVHLAVTGSPCNPFSTLRTKRFVDGAACHSMYNTTSQSVIQFYTLFEPHVGITEQVKGFDMASSPHDTETPLQKSFCIVWQMILVILDFDLLIPALT